MHLKQELTVTADLLVKCKFPLSFNVKEDGEPFYYKENIVDKFKPVEPSYVFYVLANYSNLQVHESHRR
jgi:hypothetical protein